MPAALYLEEFGSQLWAFFGEPPYLVGSALPAVNKINFRDIDVRIILDDEEWETMKLGDPRTCHQNGKWVSLCLAYSALGKSMTGLPIDFQIQQQSYANKTFEKGNRSALGIVPLRFEKLSQDRKE